MERWQGRVAFVTGASSGIGAAIAERLVKNGMIVVGFARRAENIEALAAELLKANDKGKLYPIKGDLRKEEDILSAFDWIKKNLGAVHILVNNAGCGDPFTMLDFKAEHWRRVFEVNVLALAICTREAVKSMFFYEIDEGHVVNIDSICGHDVLLYTSPMYTATKFAVTALTQALRKQLAAKKSKIRVTAINPGLAKTPLTKYIPDEIKGADLLTPSEVADAVLYTLSAKQHVHVSDLTIEPAKEFPGKEIDDFVTGAKKQVVMI